MAETENQIEIPERQTAEREEPLLVDLGEAARMCGVPPRQWSRLELAGKTPRRISIGHRTPRWRLAELREWVAAGCPDRPTWEALNEDLYPLQVRAKRPTKRPKR